MPALVAAGPYSVGSVSGLVAAEAGWVVEVSAPPGADTAGVPPGGPVVGWALVADDAAPGGARVEPVFLAAGRAWTPDQYRAAYGQGFTVRVAHD
jgi:hypothetical protein